MNSITEMTRERYWAVTDEVFKRLATGVPTDILLLLEVVGNIANGCDYVDDESIELFAQAKARWEAANVFTDAELRARDERIIRAAFDWAVDNSGWPSPDDIVGIIDDDEADQ